MRATVGPLPPAVYWRRRAVVLGAVLLGVIVLFQACSGEDKTDPKKTAAQSPASPAVTPKDQSASPAPSLEDSAPPGVGPAYPDPADLLSQQPDDGDPLPTPATTGAAANPPASGQACADTEMSLTPVPADTSPQRGATIAIKLKIKNSGTRTCTRDLGASAQELYIAEGAQRIWSSDQCAALKGNDIVTLDPGVEKVFEVNWNGKQSNQCTGANASGPVPPNGAYQLFGRLDTIVSPPVVLTVVS